VAYGPSRNPLEETHAWLPDLPGARSAAVRAAKEAGVSHFVWSTLPDVEAISAAKFDVPHFTGKAKVDRIVKEAGFVNHTFVIAPMFYQSLVGALAPQKQADGSVGWALPLDPAVRCIHMGDINELGNIVAGAFAHPDQAGNGEYLPLVGDFMRFNEIVDTLNRQGHKYSFKQVSKEVFAPSFPGGRGDRYVSLFPSSYLLGFEFGRQNCARKQDSRRATDQVLGVGPSEFPGPGMLNCAAL
jgi:hypothetical protein